MTAGTIELCVPRMRYDIMQALYDGRVEIPGVSLSPGRAPGSMIAADTPALREGDFDLADLNLGFLPQAIEAGWQVAALPVPSKRKPVLQFIWVRADRGIDSPGDLEGRVIGTSAFTTAITVFARGFLQHRYGVDLSKLRWKANARDYFPFYGEAQIEYSPDRRSPVDRLLAGEVDAIITDVSDRKAWEALAVSSEIKLLFPDYMAEDYRLYQETGIYTPVHIMVMSRKLDRAHPELAGRLYEAFERAKQIAHDDALNDRAGFSVLYQREITFEQMAKWGDPFRYGITANRATFDAYFAYSREQGIVRDLVSYEAVFASGVLGT